MELWESFIQWIEINPWRIGIAVTVVSLPFIGLVSALSRKFRSLLVVAAKMTMAGLRRLLAFAKTIRVTTTRRIDDDYQGRKAAEIDATGAPAVVEPAWKGLRLHRAPARGQWKLVNESDDTYRLTALKTTGDFAATRPSVIPRTLAPESGLTIFGNITAPTFGGPSAQVEVAWEDDHGDTHAGSCAIEDGAKLREHWF